jgi:hypothetical protein
MSNDLHSTGIAEQAFSQCGRIANGNAAAPQRTNSANWLRRSTHLRRQRMHPRTTRIFLALILVVLGVLTPSLAGHGGLAFAAIKGSGGFVDYPPQYPSFQAGMLQAQARYAPSVGVWGATDPTVDWGDGTSSTASADPSNPQDCVSDINITYECYQLWA